MQPEGVTSHCWSHCQLQFEMCAVLALSVQSQAAGTSESEPNVAATWRVIDKQTGLRHGVGSSTFPTQLCSDRVLPTAATEGRAGAHLLIILPCCLNISTCNC